MSDIRIKMAKDLREVFEDEYYRVKGFKNGNMHIEFKRDDLLDGLNDQIAEHYGNALAAA